MRRSVLLSALTCGATLFAAAHSAQADCALTNIQVLSEGVIINYDPFDREPDLTRVPLRLTASGCEGARLELTIVPEIDSLSPSGGLQASSGGQELPIDLTLNGAPARVVPNAINAFDSASRTARMAGRSAQLEGQGLVISLPYGAEVAPGRYRARANVVARTLNDDNDASDPVSTAFFVEIDVQPSFRLAAGVERPRLWLGELTKGQRSQPLTFLAFSNTHYSLKVRSERGGRMTLAGSDRTDAPGVPYALTISGRDLNWNDGRGEMRFAQPSFLLRTHNVIAVTGEVDSRRPAGDYKDWVTIEISPRLS